MPLWAVARKSLDGCGGEPGTTCGVGVEPLNDGSFLLVRYESIEHALPTSDHWYATLGEVFDEGERVYGVERTDWQQRECLPGHPCRTCGRSLDQPADPLSVNCGGDCLACTSECGDPDCVEAVEALKRAGKI